MEDMTQKSKKVFAELMEGMEMPVMPAFTSHTPEWFLEKRKKIEEYAKAGRKFTVMADEVSGMRKRLMDLKWGDEEDPVAR